MVDGDSGRGQLPSTKDYYSAIDELLDCNPEELNKFLATVNKSNLTCLLREALSRVKSTALIVDSISAVEKSIKSVPVTPAVQTVISNPSTSSQSETLHKVDEIRIQGIPERSSQITAKRFEDDSKLVTDVLEFIEKDASGCIQDVYRAGRVKPNSGKSRSIIVKLNSAWSARKLLSKAYKLKDYSSAVFLSKSLTKTGQELERTLLKKRFELSESGHDKSLIKIRDLKLYLDGQEVPINSNED